MTRDFAEVVIGLTATFLMGIALGFALSRAMTDYRQEQDCHTRHGFYIQGHCLDVKERP